MLGAALPFKSTDVFTPFIFTTSAGCVGKHVISNHRSGVRSLLGRFPSQIRSGTRLLALRTEKGYPSCTVTIVLSLQPPKKASAKPFQALPNRLPLPNGSSYVPLNENRLRTSKSALLHIRRTFISPVSSVSASVFSST